MSAAKAVVVLNPAGTPLPNCLALLGGLQSPLTNADGYALWPQPFEAGPTSLIVFANGYPSYVQSVTLSGANENLIVGGTGTPAPGNQNLPPLPVSFKPAPRSYRGNMCGSRVPGLPPVAGGAADPTLVLSWFIDRYPSAFRQQIYQTWKQEGQTDVLVSWPDSRGFGQSPQQFQATCQELIQNGFFPCVMLCSKDYDPTDTQGILNNINPVLPYLLGLVPRACIGWELSLWLSPTVVQELIDALAPQFIAAKALMYVHFGAGTFAWQQPGQPTSAFWNQNVGKLTGILHQRDPDEDNGDMGMYQARITDCLQRFAGQDGFVTDSGFGHPFDFIALEITADQQFNGEMDEATGNAWGQSARTTPTYIGPTGISVSVMGSGNGQPSL